MNSTHYIWRTVQDSKVRSSHADREGKTFSWTNPPKGGHPGEAYNCRCWAEVEQQRAEGLKQTIISQVSSSADKWRTIDFVYHFYFGNGEPVTLSEIGYLAAVIEKAREVMFHKVENQVAAKMREIKSGPIFYGTENSYPRLREVKFELGGGTIRTETNGTVTRKGDILTLDATVQYGYYDNFTDILDIRKKRHGMSSPKNIPKSEVSWTDLYGTWFEITGDWRTKLTGSIPIIRV